MGAPPGVEWLSDDRLVIDGTRYALMNAEPEPGELRLYKPRAMVEAYEPLIAEFGGANIFEIGIMAGGSAAYLTQRCEPRRFLGVDRTTDPLPELDRFVADRHLEERLVLHRGVDQADGDALVAIAGSGFGGEEIDLVIDDASHLYGPTVATFEALFPLVRLGGLYIIEDWTADDWLALMFAGLVEHRDPIGRAIAEGWLATVLAEPDNVVGQVFQRWIFHALTDAALPYHAAAVDWRDQLERPDAGADAELVAERVRDLLAADEAERADPTLGTLGLQLLLAVKGLCGSIASVTVTPWWIAVRRGGPIDAATPFTVGAIGHDRLDVIGSYRALTGDATDEVRVSPVP